MKGYPSALLARLQFQQEWTPGASTLVGRITVLTDDSYQIPRHPQHADDPNCTDRGMSKHSPRWMLDSYFILIGRQGGHRDPIVRQ